MKHGSDKILSGNAAVEALPLGMHHDGCGVYVQVTQGKTKLNRSFLYRYTFAGKAHWYGLGWYPATRLSLARKKAEGARELIAKGIDPIEHTRAQHAKAALEKATRKTFKEAAKLYHDEHKKDWRSAKGANQWLTSLENHVYPSLGSMPVSAIDTDTVVRAFDRFWTKLASATVLLGRVVTVLDWCEARGYRSKENPVRREVVQLALGAQGAKPVEHHEALAYAEIPQLMTELAAKGSNPSALFLRLTILTACRSNELLGATWSEFNLAAKCWTVPASRTKAAREHRVALSDAALAVLSNLAETRDGDKLFKLVKHAPWSMLQGMRPGVTVHGFRSSFSDWAAEVAHAEPWLVEICLAASGDKVRAAYTRTDILARRAALMAEWAEFLGSSNVVQFKQSA